MNLSEDHHHLTSSSLLFDRDLRTVKIQNLHKNDKKVENECDNSQNKELQRKREFQRKKRFQKNFISNLHIFIVISLTIVMSSSTVNMKPIDTTDNVSIHHCSSERRSSKAGEYDDNYLRERIRFLIKECEATLMATKNLTEDYIYAIWNNSGADIVHKTWENHSIDWLYPKNHQGKTEGALMKFRAEIGQSERNQIREETFDVDNISKHLEKLYLRFNYIKFGVQTFKKYFDEFRDFVREDRAMNVDKFIKSAEIDADRVLCEISSIFNEIHSEKKVKEVQNHVKSKLKEHPMGKISAQPKTDFWIIYREYETLVDYSYKLLKAVLKEDNDGM